MRLVRVPENHDMLGGRHIDLCVLVLPALQPDAYHDAEFDIDGGLGFAATDLYRFYLADGQAYRQRRDVVFVDTRGTGGSGALRCREIEGHEASSPWAALYPEALVQS